MDEQTYRELTAAVKERGIALPIQKELQRLIDKELTKGAETMVKATIDTTTIYALVDNYHDRRKTPIGIFADYDRAEEHIKQIIEKHEENKENYDYDIDEIVIDLKVFELITKLGGRNNG